MNLKAFSQVVIKNQTVPNTDTLRLHKEVAKKVVKDLVYSDALKQERILLLENIDTLKSQKIYKDSIISYKDKQIESYQGIVKIQNQKEDVYNSRINTLNKELKKQKLQKKTLIGLLALSLGFLIMK